MSKHTTDDFKIKNPQRIAFIRWIVIDIILVILGLNSFLNFDINSFDGMFILVSITVVITSFFFIGSTYKNAKLLDKAIFNKKMIAHFTYTRKEWLEYLDFEGKYRYEEAKMIAMILAAITALIFIPFILIIPDDKFAMFLVMLALFALYSVMGLIFPKVMFYLKRRTIGEVILLEKGILMNKEFHTWDFLLSKFCSAQYAVKPYKHLVVSYDFWDRTGPRNYVINIPIPKSNKLEPKDIIKQFKP